MLRFRFVLSSLALVMMLVATGCSTDSSNGDVSGDTANAASGTSDNSHPVGLETIAALAPPPPGPDTIPLRTPDGQPALYAVPEAELVQTYVGDQTGERVSIWTDYGMTYRKVENHRPSVEGAPGPRENTITITTPEKFYMLDVDTKTGNWDVNDGDEQYLKDDSLSKIPFGVMMEDISAAGVLTHVTDTTVNGYNLKVQDLNGPGYRVRLWKWRGVTLMEQFVEVGSPDPDMFWIVPSAINFSPQITEATFAEPEGYKLEKGPPRRSPFPGPGEGGPTPPGAPAPGTPGGPAPMPPPQGGR